MEEIDEKCSVHLYLLINHLYDSIEIDQRPNILF